MNTPLSIRPTALDALEARVPGLNPDELLKAKQAADLLRSLGLLSTEPAEAIRPFKRRPINPTPTNVLGGPRNSGIDFARVR